MTEQKTARAAWIAACVVLGAAGGAVGLTSAFADGDRKTESVIGASMVLPYKGYLMKDSDGLTGAQSVRFELYESATGGSSVWSSTRDVDAVDGHFSIALGESVSLNDTVLDAERLWLAMTIVEASGDQVALSGRQAIEVTPFAVWSKNAATHDVAGTLSVGGDMTVAQLVTVPGVNANGGFEGDDVTSTSAQFSGDVVEVDTASFGSATISGQISATQDFTVNGSTISLGNATSDTVTVNGTLDVSDDIQVSNDLDIVGMRTIEATSEIDFHLSSSSGSYVAMTSDGELELHQNTTVSGQFSHGSGSTLGVSNTVTVGGNASFNGGLHVTGELEHGTNCPGGALGNIDSNGSRLCVYRVSGAYNWYSASYQCFNQYGAEMCSMAELRRARWHGISNTSDTGYWLSDRTSNDKSVYTNSTDEHTFDDEKDTNNTSGISGAYCCRIVSDS